MADVADYHRARVKSAIWSGFEDEAEIDDLVDEMILDEDLPDGDTLRVFATEEFARKAAAETSWPATTDCDRLDQALADVEGKGVLPLHNAGYTMSDGHGDAAEELAEAPKGRYFGYCFYHGQDIERVLEDGELYIAFDHIEGDVPDRLRVGRVVAAALRASGLEVDWNEDVGTRIRLRNFDWKRRLVR